MSVEAKETLNPHLRKTYRVLVPTFDALVREHFPNLSDVELAKALNIEIKTLQSMREGNAIYGETIRKVSEALNVSAYAFAENQSDTDILEAMLSAAADNTKELSRWPLLQLFQKSHHLLRYINGLWHWSDRVHDDLRSHRRLFGVGQAPAGFGLFEIEFEGPLLDAILSYELVLGPLSRGRTQAVFGLFIDYGRLFKRRDETKVWAQESWILRGCHKQMPELPANRVQFISWFGDHAGNFLIRNRSAFTIKFKGLLTGEEGDRRILDKEDQLVGFQRWASHRAPYEPWAQ